MKDAVINMRVSKTDLELLDQAARTRGISRSALLREAAEYEARRVLARPRLVRARQDQPAGEGK